MAAGAAHRTERLMCLLFLIKARGRRGITRAELRECVDDYANCASETAFERMLERDKSDLRDVGVVLDVVQRDNYHEDQSAYVLGPGTLLSMPVSFDADELRVLGLAAEAWDRGTWSAMAHGALRKLEVLADAYPTEPTPRISIGVDAHLEPIRRAIRGRKSIQFGYRRPGDADPLSRHVEPWGLLYRNGGWYCVGFDLDRGATRVFRTSRIDGAIATVGDASTPVDANWPLDARDDTAAASTLRCTLLVQPGHGWTWRNGGTEHGRRECGAREYDVIAIDLRDRDDIIAALACAAPEVLVAEPVDLRARVVRHLEGVLHG